VGLSECEGDLFVDLSFLLSNELSLASLLFFLFEFFAGCLKFFTCSGFFLWWLSLVWMMVGLGGACVCVCVCVCACTYNSLHHSCTKV
jgi:hypothetical protein